MRMDLAGERFQVEADYEVELPPGDHLIVVAGAHLGEPAYEFDSPNLVAKRTDLFEFKHYRRGGGKFWTSKAGISFYFVLPKSQIELVPEKGYSYVPVLIQGCKCHLNVSGGGGSGGWTDYVRRVAHIGCGWPISALRRLAAIAINPDECRIKGVALTLEPLTDDGRRGFVERAAATIVPNRLQAGSQLVLRDGWDLMGNQGPFPVEYRPRRKRYFICVDGSSRVRVPYAAIDWPKTAELNGLVVPEPVFVNRIAPVPEPVTA